MNMDRTAAIRPARRRRRVTAVAAIVLSFGLSACGGPVTSPSGGGGASQPAASAPPAPASEGAAATLTEWDYYQEEPSVRAWAELLSACGAETGVTIDRQVFPRDELIQKVLLGAQQKQLPGILTVDNPDLQQVAATGALVPLTDYGVTTEGLYANIVDAGSYEGQVYGIAPGINGMALFYNKDLLSAAGVEPPTNWAEIKDAAAKLTGNGVYGMAFSAVANEEGSWQFEPWFWGAGADLTKLDSPEAVSALQFWVELVNSGSASKSVVQWTQGDVNDQFVAGKAAMQQNGVWNLGSLDDAGINYGIVPIPKPEGGPAPGPMGGEVLTIPATDEATQAAAGKVVNCMLADDAMTRWGELRAYIPSREAVAQQAATKNPNMASFVEAAAAERSRPGPPANLGPNYNKVSQALWNAIQSAITGGRSPQDALTEAQQQASQ